MGQVTASSLKESGDWTYAEDEARWHSPAEALECYELRDVGLRVKLGVIPSRLVVADANLGTVLYVWGVLSEGLYVFIKEQRLKH